MTEIVRKRRELDKIGRYSMIIVARLREVLVVQFDRDTFRDLCNLKGVSQPISKKIGFPGKQLRFTLKAPKGRTVD